MSAITTRRMRILPRVVVGVLIAFSAAWAGPPESPIATRGWDPRHSHDLESLRGPPTGTMGMVLPVAFESLKFKYHPTKGFYESYLVARLSHGLRDEIEPAADPFAISTSNLWARDSVAVQRVEGRAIRSVTGALKGFLIERIGFDRWSLPLTRGGSRSPAAPGNGAGGMRVRFGFSHMAPRADFLIPVAAGRVVVSASARGRVGTTFEPTTSRLRLVADVDVPEHVATVHLGLRF